MREDEKQLGDCRDDSDEGLTAREREQDVISSSIAEDRRRERQQAREEVQFYEEVGTRLLEKIIEEGKINPELLKLVKDMLKTDWWRVLLRVIAETGQSEVVKLKDGEVHLPGSESYSTLEEYLRWEWQDYGI